MQKYEVHDNGGRPFSVLVSDKKVQIVRNPQKEDEKAKLIKKTTAEKVHVGFYKNPEFTGNSVLIEMKRKFIFVGWKVQEFSLEPKDQIERYFSMVGNSDVPYPVLVGEKNVYFMLDMKFVPRSEFPPMRISDWENAYAWYYGHKGDKKLESVAQDMRGVKVIHERLY